MLLLLSEGGFALQVLLHLEEDLILGGLLLLLRILACQVEGRNLLLHWVRIELMIEIVCRGLREAQLDRMLVRVHVAHCPVLVGRKSVIRWRLLPAKLRPLA